MTREEFARLVEAVSGPHVLRDRAAILVAWGTAARASEVVGMRLERVDYSERSIAFWRRKVSDWHRVVLPDRSWEALEQHLRALRLVGSVTVGPVFASSRTGGALTENGFWRVVRKWGMAAGLPVRKCHPHVLRRTRAQWLSDAGADIYQIRALLGHASVQVTQEYLSYSASAMAGLARVGV
jgi:integrase/recombinase XerD